MVLEIDLFKYSNQHDLFKGHVYDDTVTIPKVLHYVWLGDKEPGKLEKYCIESWKKFLPNYEIVRWDETNFPFELYPFAQAAYEQKQYCYASDVIRLHAIYNYGGIYLDTDVEVLRSFDDLLDEGAFAAYETPNLISLGQFGAKQYHPWIKELLSFYIDTTFKISYQIISNTRICSKITRKRYHARLDGTPKKICNDASLYERAKLFPVLNSSGEYDIDADTYCIHHMGPWRSNFNKRLHTLGLC